MQFESLADFIAMGKHGLFVWSCYAVFLVIMAVNVVAPNLRRSALIKRLQRIEKRQSGAMGARPAATLAKSE